MSDRYPLLSSAVRLGRLELRNRTMMSAHGMGLADGYNTVSPRYHQYLVERARGGAALLGMESAPVTPDMQNRSLRIRLYEDDVIDALGNLAEAVHRADAKLSITLWHGGHTESFMRGRVAVSPSAIPNMSGEVPRVIRRDEIAALVVRYADAAERCMRAGLDAIEVQTSTNYLLGSFLNPTLNHREDEYGGSRTNRLRIVVEILEAIRERVGESLAVGVRTSVRHGIPGAPEDYDDDESLACMNALADTGLLDWVHIMTGSSWSSGQSIPPMDAPRPQLEEPGLRFKGALPVAVITSGNVRSPAEAEALLAAGAADAVSMARSWIADAEWGNKALQGRSDEIVPCVSCNQGCVGFVWRGIPGTCVVNARAGREIDLPQLRRVTRAQQVHVVGGGPAGMEVARLAATAGHRVNLYERRPALGGDLRLAAMGPSRQRWLDALKWWQDSLRRLGVSIELERAIQPDHFRSGDVVIWATGARPSQMAVLKLRPFLRSGIPGASELVHGRQLMADASVPGKRLLVIDEEGGWPTVSLVEWLCGQGCSVTVVTTERSLGEGQLAVSLDLKPLADRLGDLDLELITGEQVEAVVDGEVRLASGKRFGGFDAIVLSTGTTARRTPPNGLSAGDCVAPRGLWAAATDAAWLVRSHLQEH